jgi:hypothetical protein
MTCRELTDFLFDYNYEQTIKLGKDVCAEDHDAVADDVPEELVQAILRAAPSHRSAWKGTRKI